MGLKRVSTFLQLLVSLPGTLNTYMGGRVELQALGVDVLAALKTYPECTIANALERRSDTLTLELSPTRGLYGHRLYLQRIHTRDTPNSGLVEFDGLCGFPTTLLDLHELITKGE